MSDNAKIRLQIASDSIFNNIISTREVDHNENSIVDLGSEHFSGSVAPTDESLYMRAKHISDHGESPWSNVVNFTIRNYWVSVPNSEGNVNNIHPVTAQYLCAVRLDSLRTFICYRNDNSSGRIFAVIVSVAGSVLSIGTPIQCNTVPSEYLTIEKIKDNKVLIVYYNATNKRMEGIVTTISSSTIVTKTPTVLRNGQSYHISSDILSVSGNDTQVILGFSNAVDNSHSQTYTSSTSVTIPVGISSITMSGYGSRGKCTASAPYLEYNSSGIRIAGGGTSPGNPPIVTEIKCYTSMGSGELEWRSGGSCTYEGTSGDGIHRWMCTATDCWAQYQVTYYPNYCTSSVPGQKATAVLNGTTYDFSGTSFVTNPSESPTVYSDISVNRETTQTISLTIPTQPQSGSQIEVSYGGQDYSACSQVLTIGNDDTITAGQVRIIDPNRQAAIQTNTTGITSTIALISYIDITLSNSLYTYAVNTSNASSVYNSKVSNKVCGGMDAVDLGNSEILIVYMSTGDSNKLYAKVLKYESGGVAVPSTEVLLVNTKVSSFRFARPISGRPVLVYTDSNNSNSPYTTVITVIDGVITNSTPVRCSSITNMSQIQPVLSTPGVMTLLYLNNSSRPTGQVLRS